jgi:hypothetical protein
MGKVTDKVVEMIGEAHWNLRRKPQAILMHPQTKYDIWVEFKSEHAFLYPDQIIDMDKLPSPYQYHIDKVKGIKDGIILDGVLYPKGVDAISYICGIRVYETPDLKEGEIKVI